MNDDEKDFIDPTNVIDLNLFPITPTKRRRRRPKIDWDIKKIQEARLNKAKFLLNLEEYKKSKELEKEDEVFQSAGKKLPTDDNDDDDYDEDDYFQPVLIQRIYSMDCKFQFKVMATVPDDITAKCCYRRLVLNEFAVPFMDMLTVFLNWGASVESLGISSMPVGNINLPVTPQKRNCCGKLSCHNVEYVLKYVQHFHSAWQTNEIIILVLVLISAALDKTLRRCYNLFLGPLSRLLHRLEKTEIIQTASLLIKNFKIMDILNALFVCVNLIPVSDKSNLFSTTASNGLLQIILGKEFPVEDDCVWNVLDMLVQDQRDPNSYFQHLYVVIKLVENITIKRFKNNSKCQEINLKNFTILLTSASNLQTNIKYSNTSNHLDNLHMIKEILVRLINHSEKLLQTLRRKHK